MYVSDQYKRVVLEHMSIEQLIDTLMINPTVHLSPSYRDTGLHASYTFQPLSNLVYTRDQQITGCKGIIMGRLRSQQRQLECELMRFCFTKLGECSADKYPRPRHQMAASYPPACCPCALIVWLHLTTCMPITCRL